MLFSAEQLMLFILFIAANPVVKIAVKVVWQIPFVSHIKNGFGIVTEVGTKGNERFVRVSNILRLITGRELIETQVILICELDPKDKLADADKKALLTLSLRLGITKK